MPAAGKPYRKSTATDVMILETLRPGYGRRNVPRDPVQEGLT